MAREKGRLVRWNEEKGFGFINPDNGDGDIFFHIRSLPHYQRRPVVDDLITYEIGVDENQRYHASRARIRGLAMSRFTILSITLSLIFLIYIYFVLIGTLIFHPVAIYAGVSLVAIYMYSRDKSAAQYGLRRTPENRLHLVELLGGWPGAFLAQRFYHHKSSKIPYQIKFWIIVLVHCLLWGYTLTHQEIYLSYRQAVTEKIRSFAGQLSDQIPYISRFIDSGKSGTDYKYLSDYKHLTGGEKQARSGRSVVIPGKGLRVVNGTVKEIRPGEGVVVSLQHETWGEGIIDRSTLVENFSSEFRLKERLKVAIYKIKMRGNSQSIELILVEK